VGSTTFDIDPLEATVGATVRGVQLAELDDTDFRAIRDAWMEFGLLIFRGQFLTRDQQAHAHRRRARVGSRDQLPLTTVATSRF
jgi:alpha-ketoglutarate-dependent taurine dioxygenase